VTDVETRSGEDEAAVAVPGGLVPGLRAARRARLTLRPPSYRRHSYLTVGAVMAAVALLGPGWAAGSRSDQFLLNLWLAYSIAAVGAYWVFGLAGRFGFCQTFMMALGGFTSAWMTRESGGGQEPVVGLLAAVLVTGAVALLVGIATRRTRDFYFAIATLALTRVGFNVFQRWEGFSGKNGTTVGIEPLRFGGREYLQEVDVFWVLAAVLTAVLLLAVLIERSPLRRESVAGRANPLVAATIGLPSERNQIVLFALGSSLGGLSGALIAHWNGVVGIESFGIDLSIGILLILLLGGLGSMWGPLLGTAFYVAVPRLLDDAERYSQIVYGLLLLVVVIAFPDGIVGGVRRALSRAEAQLARWRQAGDGR
jgi:branched-chain amino acid transport system permease protein